MSANEALNPYESPQQVERPPPSARVQALRGLRSAALALLLLSGGQVVCTVLVLILMIIAAISAARAEIPFNSFLAMLGWSFLVQLAILFALSFVQALLLRAAICMRRLRYLRFCRTMAIVSCIPFFSPLFCLGIPFGIWATVLLFQKKVAEEFDKPE